MRSTTGADQIGDERLAAAMAMIDGMGKHVRVMLGTWGSDVFNMIESKISSKLREKGPMSRRDLWHVTKNRRRYNLEQWVKTLKAMTETGIIAHDPSGVFFLVDPDKGSDAASAVS